jgi:hypothetical protein
MGEVVNLKPEPSAADKADLIKAGRDQLVAAQSIDERDSLSDQEARAWYDAVIPNVTDIKVIAGALEIELAKRRGQAVLAEGERPGQPPKDAEIKVPHRDTLINAERQQRKYARTIARNVPLVDEYVKRAAERGKVPSVRGALIAVGRARPKGHARAKTTGLHKVRGRGARWASFFAALDELAALEQPLDQTEAARRLGYHGPYAFQTASDRLRFLPWLKISRSVAGVRFEIDHELREICELRRARPDLGGFSVGACLRQMRAEIIRRKKEEHDYRYSSDQQWHSERVRFKFAFELLTYVESELDRLLANQLS